MVDVLCALHALCLVRNLPSPSFPLDTSRSKGDRSYGLAAKHRTADQRIVAPTAQARAEPRASTTACLKCKWLPGSKGPQGGLEAGNKLVHWRCSWLYPAVWGAVTVLCCLDPRPRSCLLSHASLLNLLSWKKRIPDSRRSGSVAEVDVVHSSWRADNTWSTRECLTPCHPCC